MKSEEITTIRSGLVLKRKEAKPDSLAFGYQALNLRSIDPMGFIDTPNWMCSTHRRRSARIT